MNCCFQRIQFVVGCAVLTICSANCAAQTFVSSFSLGGTVVGGSSQTVSGTITIQRTIGYEDPVFINITNANAPVSVTCPTMVDQECYVPEGSDTVSCTAMGGWVLQNETATLTAKADGFPDSGMTASVTVIPPTMSLTISPGAVVGGSTQTAQGTITVSAMPASSWDVELQGNADASFPPGVNLTSTTGQFTITPTFVTQQPNAGQITATLANTSTANLTVNPFGISVSASPSTIRGDNQDTGQGTVTLNPPPANTQSVQVSDSLNILTGFPLSVNVGTSGTGTFNYKGSSPNDSLTTVVTASIGPTATTSVTLAPGPDPNLPCPQCEAQAGMPINFTNGNVWITQQDYSLPGLGGGLSLSRTWNSLWLTNDVSLAASGTFGNSWRSTYDEYLHVIDQNDVKYIRANGDGWYFLWNAGTQNYQVVTPPDQHATLTYSSSTMLYTMVFMDGTTRIFHAGGYLSKIVDRNANTIIVTHDASNRISTVTDPASRVWTFSYGDPVNTMQATSVADSSGTIATYNYDSSSRLTKVTFADGTFDTFNYDSGGNSLITSVLDSQGKVLESHTYDGSRRGLTSQKANGVDAITVSYPSQGTVTLADSFSNGTTFGYAYTGPVKRVNSIVGPTCHSCGAQTSQSFTFDPNGNKLTSTDGLGFVTTYTYDPNSNMLSKSTLLANGTTPTWNYTYNSFGEVLTIIDPLGHQTTNVYDPNGNLLTATTPSPDGGNTPASTTTFTYNTNGTLKTIKDPLLNLTQLAYYATGQLKTVTDAMSKVTTYVYDARGNRTSIQDPVNGATKLTSFGFDAMNRLTSLTLPAVTTSTQFHYDYRGRKDYVLDPNSKKTSYGYDDADRLISVTDAQTPTPGVTQYGYDTESNLTSITDALNHQTILSYDPERRLSQTKFPSLLVENYGYDADNNLTSKTDRNNQTIQYGYDALGNLTSKTYPDSSVVNYTLDLASRLTEIQDSTGTYTFTFDNMNRLTQSGVNYSFNSVGTLTVGYGYDAASNRKTMSDPQSLATAYNYDALNRLSTLAFNGQTPAFSFGYDALSRRNSLGRPNGVATSYSYDPASNLLSTLHKLGTTTLDGTSYTYDNAGTRTAHGDKRTNITLTLGYDNIYQLLSAKQGATSKETYTYDLVGNRLTSMSVSPYQYNTSNELTTLPSGAYTYDSNGNTKTKPDGTQYSWDYENRMTQVVLPGTGGTVNFKYDPFGRRIQKAFTHSGTTTITNYIYDGMDIAANTIEEVDNGGNVIARYTQNLAIDQPLSEVRGGATSYYQQDPLGSVTSVSNSAGALANTYTYDSFGKLTASSGTLTNPFQFAGRDVDSETGLSYNRHRFYDQTIGRFISEDPSRFGGGTNFYRYVNNSPTGSVDPLGLARCVLFVSNGMLYCFPQQPGHDAVIMDVASGNNGDGMQCKNNPNCDLLRNRGPIPKGNWQWTNDPTSKPNGRVLVPTAGTLTWGRDLFRSHSCGNPFGASVSSPFCSEGCVTGSPDDIMRLNNLIDSEPGSTLNVTD